MQFSVSLSTVFRCSLERAFKAPMLCDISKVHTGFLVKQDAGSISVKIATGQTVVFPSAEVKSQQTLPISLMPEGLMQTYTAQEAADLAAYLSSLK